MPPFEDAPPQPRVLVTGATGCVGRALVPKLQKAGWHVRGLARSTSRPREDAGCDELIAADVADADRVRAAARGCRAIVHLASWVHKVPRSAEEEAALRRSIIDGSRHVATAARAEGAQLLFASTVAVYGSGRSEVCDETAEPRPDSAYARAKLEAETAVRATCPDATLLRFALVFGPHDRGNFLALVRAVDRRRAVVVGNGTNPKSLVYVEHLADRLTSCLAHPDKVRGRIFNVADEPPPTQAELMRLIAAALGRRPPPRLPYPVLAWGARLVDKGRALLARRTLERPFADQVWKLAAPTAFSGRALDRALGYSPSHTLDEAVRATVRWYRDGAP